MYSLNWDLLLDKQELRHAVAVLDMSQIVLDRKIKIVCPKQ